MIKRDIFINVFYFFKRNNLILFLLFLAFYINSIELPRPKNDQLFSEYDSFRYAKFLKKPIVGSGYLAMDGKNKFVFIQSKPIYVKIKKNEGSTTYQKGNTMPVDITAMSMDFFFLFEDEISIEKRFDVTKNINDTFDEYKVVPKENSNLKLLIITAKDDKIKKLEMYFQDDSKLIYLFKNILTGQAPDEKYF